MNRGPRSSVLRRVFAWASLIIGAVFLTQSFFVLHGFVFREQQRREQTLLSAAQLLSYYVRAPFSTIAKYDVLETDAVATLNGIFQPIIENTSKAFPKLGLGLYSMEHDSIIAVHPYSIELLTSISRELPYFESYRTREPHIVRPHTSVSREGKPLLVATYPLIFEGEVLGHSWANITIDDLYRDALAAARIPLAMVLAVGMVTQGLVWGAYGLLRRNLKKCADNAVAGRQQASEMIPELEPLLQSLELEIEKRTHAQTELKRIFDLSKDLICVVRCERYVQVNAAFTKTLGYEVEEVIDKPALDFVHQLDREASMQVMKDIMAEGNIKGPFENRHICTDGSIRWISWVAVASVTEEAIYAIGRDITEYKRLQEEVMRLDRLNLAGQMAAGIGHEIRNPMTTIRGFLQILQKKYLSTSDARYFSLMIDELDRANGIISEFLSLARSNSTDKGKHKLNTIINALAPLIQADSFLGDNELVIDPGAIPELYLDEKEIRQLILNLARNSLEAMNGRGKLTISTYMEGDQVVLAVIDTGPGIPEHLLSKLGTPFFTTKEQGTGLGLAISYRIAADHHASVKVDTGPNGTSFYICFNP